MAQLKQPNILVICSDEHHPFMTGYRKHPYIKTPNLDKLAERGAVFNRAYCNSPVCTPSRMSFITGKYVHQIDNWFIGVPLDRKESTWASRLNDAGIESTMLGKMDFCGEYQSGGFSNYKIIEKRGAYDIYPRTSPLLSRLSGYVREDKRRHILNSGIRKDIVTDGRDGHNDKLGFYDHDRIVTQWALEYLEEKAKRTDDSPWALYVGLLYPHWPYLVPEKYFNMYYPDNIEMPIDFVVPVNDKLHPEIKEFQKAQDLTNLTEDDYRRTIASYYGMITAMDEMIGKIINKLEQKGMLENTYIIYTSDHGDSMGEHGLFYKQCSYEGSVGVPLLVSGPDIPANTVIDTPVSLIDMYPTIMDFANLETEKDRYGESWKKIIDGKSDRHYILSEYHGNFFKRDWYMLTDEKFKYTYYINSRPALYNILEDPHEMNDLSSDPKYEKVLVDFEKKLREILDPEEVSMRSKHDLGLISEDGEDYTETLSMKDVIDGYKTGRFSYQPEVPPPLE